MPWWDFYKLWTYSFEKDPLSKKTQKTQIQGAGISSPDMPDIRGDGSMWGGGAQGALRLIDSNDFVDLSTVTNRQSRLKEYERLRNVAEIEMAMTVIADESCVGGLTKIATLFNGLRTIEWLTKRWKEDQKPFLVYCWDFSKNDYTLGWATHPRKIKRCKTVKVMLDDGSHFEVTDDHRILTGAGNWTHAGDLKHGDDIKPFYRMTPNRRYNKLREGQYPRLFTFDKGWVTQQQFIDEWRTGKNDQRLEKVNKACRLLAEGLTYKDTAKIMEHDYRSIKSWVTKQGWTPEELEWLGKKPTTRRVIGVMKWHEMDVYDLSVEGHENFCTESAVMHNCQLGENEHVFDITCDDEEVLEELEFLCFHRKMLNLDRKSWQMVKRLCIYGDLFFENIVNPDEPKQGILKFQELPPDSMYRIETVKGKLVEFQQSKEGPDYQALTRNEVTKATEAELQQATAIRFAPNQVIHFRIGDDRKTFYPYGQSLIEPARGPAHQLRLMEDAMVVYRLTRAPERRVFYIDVGQLPAFKAEAFMERIKDQFRKKKVASGKGAGAGGGASAVEERWSPMAADEDYWLPIRQGANTRIETLPGAQNLGEIDDALYFRNKLFTALNFPRNYFNNEDPGATRITLSAQDVKFARMIERIQTHFIDGIIEVCERHLELRGYPEESFEGLKIKMTPPSEWRELSKAEVMNNRISIITSLKGSMILSDFDLMRRYLHLSEDETEELISRNKIQKLEDLKLQIIGQNPQLMGVGVPGIPSGETEMGTEAGGPNPMLGPEGSETPPPPQPSPEGGAGAAPGGEQGPPTGGTQGAPQPGGGGVALVEPSEDDIKFYDLEIQDYTKDQDAEDIDYSEEI